MRIQDHNTDFLCAVREKAKEYKNYLLSDQIRNELDSRGSFCFDTPKGQVVYHLGKGYTRDYVSKNLQQIDRKFT